jgi:hypothetical protein
VPDVGDTLRRVVELGGEVDLPETHAGGIAEDRHDDRERIGLVRG